jgi:hypothetical protein
VTCARFDRAGSPAAGSSGLGHRRRIEHRAAASMPPSEKRLVGRDEQAFAYGAPLAFMGLGRAHA